MRTGLKVILALTFLLGAGIAHAQRTESKASDIDASADCVRPRYRVIRDFVNRQSGHGALHISLPPAEFTLTHLLCLTDQFSRNQTGWQDVVVLFFSSDEAAALFDASGMSDFREIIGPAG